jgi:hypothetical protein
VVVTTSGACTARRVLPLTTDTAADIVVVPAARPEANPLGVMVATPGFEEVHVAWLVISCTLPSE